MPRFAKIAGSDDIQPGQGRMFEVGGKKIGLFNVDGSFYAIDDACAHRGGPRCETRRPRLLCWPTGVWPSQLRWPLHCRYQKRPSLLGPASIGRRCG